MKTWTQFFHTHNGNLQEACGDRAVVILDGRQAKFIHHMQSKQECIKRGYEAYQIHRGEAFTRSVATTDVIKVT